MRIRSVLIGSAAVAALAIAVPSAVPEWSPIGTADAAVSASISINTFYTGLARNGDWIRHNGIYVFVPINVPDGWRPYTVGHWVFTREYGWLWVSAEPFGWATYHYGRWGYADDIGWYWVPGTKWAPAWVSWRRSKGYIAWAPLPPPRAANVIIDVSFGDVPDYYWIPVPTRSFLEINLSVVIVKDRRERDSIIKSAEPLGEVRVENNVVVNNVVDVNFIRQETKKDVKEVEVKQADQPERAKAEGNAATVFRGDVEAEANAKPPEVKDTKQAEQAQAKRKDKPTENAAETSTTGGGKAPEGSQSTGQQPEGQAPEQKTGEQPRKEERKQQTGEQPAEKGTQSGEKQPAAGEQPQEKTGEQTGKERKQQQTGEQPQEERQKKKQQTTGQPPASEGTQQGAGEQPKKEKKPPEQAREQAPAEGQRQEDITGSTKPAPEGAQEPRQREQGKRGKERECDPSDPDCPKQQ